MYVLVAAALAVTGLQDHQPTRGYAVCELRGHDVLGGRAVLRSPNCLDCSHFGRSRSNVHGDELASVRRTGVPVRSLWLSHCCEGACDQPGRTLVLVSFSAPGSCLRAVAAFYVIGACAYLFAQGFAARTPIEDLLVPRASVRGAVVWVIGPAAYFTATGRLHAHLEWTYVFPALYYPSNTVFLGKLLIKTSFFLALLAAAVACSVIRAYPTRSVSQRGRNAGASAGCSGCARATQTASIALPFPAVAFFPSSWLTSRALR